MERAAGGDKVNFPRGDEVRFGELKRRFDRSVPLLLKKLYFSLPGVKAASVFASMARSGSSSSAMEVVSRVDSVRRKPLLDYGAPR